MASPLTSGGAEAPPAPLPFPQTPRAIRHYERGMDAAGFLSLLLLEREGGRVPANVVRFDEPDGPELPSRSAELLLAMLIWDTLPAKQRDRIKSIVRGMAYSHGATAEAVRLHNMLSLNAVNGRR